jgi:glycosyltransferase involved in cell wall biosynthesis
MIEIENAVKPHFFIITFHVGEQKEVTYLRWVQGIISPIFKPLKNSYRIEYLNLKKKGATLLEEEKSIRYFNAKSGFFRLPFSLFFYIRKHKPAVVFVHGFLYPIQLFVLYFFLSKTTKVMVQHHAEKPNGRSIKKWLQKIAYSKVDAYLFASKDLAMPYLQHHIIKDKHRIHEVMEVSSHFSNRNKERIPYSFLWVGRLNANKDPLTMLKGFHAYLTHNSKATLKMIYGTTDLEKEVKSFIAENNMSASVSLLGEVPHQELEDYYNASQFFIAASHYEGSGTALCEAMSCGCIPVVSNIAAFRFMTDNGSCALLFETGNEKHLSEKLKDTELLNITEMREKILHQFRIKLSSEAIGNNMNRIASELLIK